MAIRKPTLPVLESGLWSWRAETRRPTDDEGDGTPHGGTYTVGQLRALVAYAEQRGITVVPEIDLPGHALALLAAALATSLLRALGWG